MRVLFIGEVPEAVDFDDPALPPGLSAEKIHAGIKQAMDDMASRGWQATLCLIEPDASAGPTVQRELAGRSYDCVVIGAGIRVPPKSLLLFETLINAVREAAPAAAIAFNTNPTDTAAAADRWLKHR
jgi:hypothetical protein